MQIKFNTEQFKEKQKTVFDRRKRLIEKATPHELAFIERLRKAGIAYIFQKGFILGDQYCIADFYLPKPRKIVVEIDGEYHSTEKQILRDKYKDEYYRTRGFTVIRIKNTEVYDFDISKLK